MQIKLKTATNKDLKLLDTIPSLNFAAKIRLARENIKTTLKKAKNVPAESRYFFHLSDGAYNLFKINIL